MASLNPLTRELVFKIVFYGPGLGGKTTTLQYIHAATKPEHRGKMVSLATPMDRTLYFDFLPLRVPRVRGMSVRLQLFTVPGQLYYGATRKLVLTGADGVVFVADSQRGREDANQESLEDLVTNLADHNRAFAALPHTYHWNKRDIADVVPTDDLDRSLNPEGAPSLGTIATRGGGVFEGLERITRLVMRAYEAELPKNDAASGLARSDSEDAGIADAIRGLTESTYGRSTPFTGTRVMKVEAAAASSSLEAIPSPVLRRPASSPDLTPFLAGSAAVNGEGETRAEVEVPDVATAPPPPAVSAATEEIRQADVPLRVEDHANGAATAEARDPDARFSFVSLWSESERESAREAEDGLAASDALRAVLACDVLVTRVLASTAGMAGNADAPRDPGVVALLLGLEGGRYLAFRAVVRAARAGEAVPLREALDAYAFALEARRARDAVAR